MAERRTGWEYRPYSPTLVASRPAPPHKGEGESSPQVVAITAFRRTAVEVSFPLPQAEQY